MPKTGRNIYKRRDGRWEGRYLKGYKEDGSIDYGYVYAESCAEAKDKLTAAIISPTHTTRTGTQLTFADISKKWLYSASLRIKQSTYAHYSFILENHILCRIGGFKMNALSAPLIDRFAKNMLINGRKDGKGGLSPKTIRDILSIVKSVIDYARDERIAVNDIRITYPKRSPQAMRVLSKREQSALVKVLIENPDIYKIGVLLCLYTGIRIGEICALRWKDISLDKGIITIRETIQRIRNIGGNRGKKTRIIIDTPKTMCSIRNIPLPKTVIALLSHYVSDGGKFFLSGDGFNRTEPRTLQNRFKKYVETANIAHANFHSTRHTFATRCVEAGMDIKSLSEILGHAGVNITLNRYVHSSFEQKREGMNKLEVFVSKF